MQTSIRVATATMLMTGAATLSGCSMFSSPSAECGGESETRILGQLLVESGEPGGALVAVNAQDAIIAGDAGPAAISAQRVKAIAAANAPWFAVRYVITKERKSKKSAVCTAQIHFAANPPENYPKDRESLETWTLASKTYWSVEYTADVTDKGDEVLVALKNGDCAGPGCEAAKTAAAAAQSLQGLEGDAIIKFAAVPAVPAVAQTEGEINDSNVVKFIQETKLPQEGLSTHTDRVLILSISGNLMTQRGDFSYLTHKTDQQIARGVTNIMVMCPAELTVKTIDTLGDGEMAFVKLTAFSLMGFDDDNTEFRIGALGREPVTSTSPFGQKSCEVFRR